MLIVSAKGLDLSLMQPLDGNTDSCMLNCIRSVQASDSRLWETPQADERIGCKEKEETKEKFCKLKNIERISRNGQD